MAPESWEKQQAETAALKDKAMLRGWAARRQTQETSGENSKAVQDQSAKVREKGPQLAEGMERCRAERGLGS